MLKRAALEALEAWKERKTGQALMLMGARQVGKTTLVRMFAEDAYESVAEVNFLEDRRAATLLAAAENTDDLLLRISALTGKGLEAGRTLLFLDEVQECQDMLTWVKFLSERRDLDIILSGSLLGLESFVHVRSLPVGYLKKQMLYPLSFCEFCAATGVAREVWERMEQCVRAHVPVPSYIHDELIGRFRTYLLVGGMPDAVRLFVDDPQLPGVRDIQQGIVELYEDDIAKYVADPVEARQIRMVYRSVPGQLNAPSKRFKYARLGKNLRFANMETAFDWLGAAGVCIEATRVGGLTYPLGLSEDRANFKLFPNDVGLLTSRLMGSVALDVLSERDDINYGSIYESAVAQELFAQGLAPHYYASKRRGEVDFVVEDIRSGTVVPIEVKSGKSYKRHNALDNLLADGLAQRAVVLSNGNVEQRGDRLYLPVYATPYVLQV